MLFAIYSSDIPDDVITYMFKTNHGYEPEEIRNVAGKKLVGPVQIGEQIIPGETIITGGICSECILHLGDHEAK